MALHGYRTVLQLWQLFITRLKPNMLLLQTWVPIERARNMQLDINNEQWMPRRIRNSIKKKKKPRLAFPCRTKPEEHCPRKPYSKCGTRSSRVFRQDMHRYTWKSFPRSNKTEKRNPTPICTLRDLERFHKGKTEVGHSRRFHTYIMLHLQCLPRIKKKQRS